MYSDYITIGKITRPAGIRGEVKVSPLTDDPQRFKRLKVVYIASKPYRIESCRISGDDVFLRFTGVADRNEAEKLRDGLIEIDRINAVPLGDDKFFISDIIGCKLILSDGSELGNITGVNSFGAADVFTASDGKRTLRFPFLKRLIVKIDPESGVAIFDKAAFYEVCVYED